LIQVITRISRQSSIFSPRFVIVAAVATALLLSLGCSPATREASFLKRGKHYLENGDYARALLEFRNARQVMPHDAEPYYQEGVAYLGLGNRASAFQSLSKAIRLNPKHVSAQVKLTELLASSDRHLYEAEQHGKTALSLAPDNPDALNALATAELKLGNEAEALRYLEEALAKSPQHLRSSMSLAIIKLSGRDFAGAERILQQAVAQAPESAEAQTALGELYAVLKRPDDAERRFRSALKIDPLNAPALFYLGSIQLAKGQKGQADQTYRRISALPDKRFKPLHAVYLLETGHLDAAIAELERLRKQDPDDRGLRTRLVRAYVQAKRLDDAKNLLHAALQNHSKDVEALLQESEIELMAGNLREAQQDIHEVINSRPDSAEAHFLLSRVHLAAGDLLSRRQELTEALRLNPKLVSVRIELARTYTLANSPGTALSVLDQTSEEQKQTVPVIAERNWALLASQNLPELRKGVNRGLALARVRDLLLQNALLKISDRDVPGARSSLEEILKAAPDDVEALEVLAQTYTEQKQPKVALEKINFYVAQRPGSAPLHELRGRYLLAQGKPDEARAAFIMAKAADPKYLRADLALAQLDRATGRTDAARQTLSALLATQAKNGDASLVAHLLMADLEQAAGNHAAELEHWRKVAEADHTNVVALNNLAYVLLEYAKQPDEALKYAQQAHELAPDNPDIEDTVAWALYQKGIYGTALQHLEHAVSLDGKSRATGSTVRKYHLAMAYLKNGKRERGMQVLIAAQKVDGSIPEARMAESVLAQGRQENF
jgi:tetratricopeptide (TPR) repeat protein